MKIIGSEKLEDFIKKHADARNAIEKWVEKIEVAEWKNHNELKNDFLSADYVGIIDMCLIFGAIIIGLLLS